MQHILGRRQVSLTALQHHAQVAEVLAPILPTGPLHSYRVVAPRGLQHAQQPLMAANDKVSAPLLLVLPTGHQLGGGQVG